MLKARRFIAVAAVCAALGATVETVAAQSASAASSAPAPAPSVRASTAGSLSGPSSPSMRSRPSAKRCAFLRKRYLDSQACFNRYRLVNRGLSPEAFKHCRNVVDPSPHCGPDLPTE